MFTHTLGSLLSILHHPPFIITLDRGGFCIDSEYSLSIALNLYYPFDGMGTIQLARIWKFSKLLSFYFTFKKTRKRKEITVYPISGQSAKRYQRRDQKIRTK